MNKDQQIKLDEYNDIEKIYAPKSPAQIDKQNILSQT